LYLMLAKCHEYLHHLVRWDRNCVDQDIFEQIASTNEPIEKLVKRELLVFKRYELDVKDIKCPLQWWQKHETMFATIRFLADKFWVLLDFKLKHKEFFFG
jgi:hypothetical protein